jgi:ADP-ribose pyrophosphatase YjhB (NUDIX family)
MIRTIERRLVYENDYVRVFDDRVAFADGHEGTYYHSRWKAPYGVAVVPVAKDGVLLIHSFRYDEGAYSLEIPRGFGNAARSPREQAVAELREETGLEAGALNELFRLGGDYQTHVFIARIADPSRLSLAGQEKTEDISGFEWIPFGDLTPAGLAGRNIREPMTVASLLGAAAVL